MGSLVAWEDAGRCRDEWSAQQAACFDTRRQNTVASLRPTKQTYGLASGRRRAHPSSEME